MTTLASTLYDLIFMPAADLYYAHVSLVYTPCRLVLHAHMLCTMIPVDSMVSLVSALIFVRVCTLRSVATGIGSPGIICSPPLIASPSFLRSVPHHCIFAFLSFFSIETIWLHGVLYGARTVWYSSPLLYICTLYYTTYLLFTSLGVVTR